MTEIMTVEKYVKSQIIHPFEQIKTKTSKTIILFYDQSKKVLSLSFRASIHVARACLLVFSLHHFIFFDVLLWHYGASPCDRGDVKHL